MDNKIIILILIIALIVVLPESQRMMLGGVLIAGLLYMMLDVEDRKEESNKCSISSGNGTVKRCSQGDYSSPADVPLADVLEDQVGVEEDDGTEIELAIPPVEEANVDDGVVTADEGQHWLQNEKSKTCYPPPSTPLDWRNANSYLSFDEAHARFAALRQRDKQAIDGAATKNVNYYRKHFGNELDLAEKQRWWGNDEY